MTFRDFVADKTVAVVGCAAYLMGTKQREKVESYDLVVRINRGFPVPAQLSDDIGTRCDVLYHLMSVGIASNEHDFSQCLGHVRFIVSVYPDLTPKAQSFKRLNRGRIPFECVPSALRQIVHAKVRKSPNAGVVTLAHLLAQPVKAVYVTGFSFYEDGYYLGYRRDWSEKQHAAMKGGQLGHDQGSAKRFVKHLVSTDPRVSIDERMAQILFGGPVPAERQPEPIMQQPGKQMMIAMTPLRTQHGMVMRGEQFFADNNNVDFLERTRKAVRV